MAFDQTLAERVRVRLAFAGAVREVRMFGGLTFMLNEHMCCGVGGSGLYLRLGADAAAAIGRGEAQPFMPTRSPAAGMVTVANDATLTDARLNDWLAQAVAQTLALPPRR